MTTLDPAAVEHADQYIGWPVFEQDGTGLWAAFCSALPFLANPCPTGWEVTGCESRAEAGATFYGHNPRGDS